MSKQKTTYGPLATPEGRLSWPSLAAPNTTGKYPDNKYSATILIPKTANFDALKAACLEAAKLTWPQAGITDLSKLKLPFKAGDDKPDQEGYPGTVYLTCKTKNKPIIVGPDRQDYAGPLKAGDYIRLSVTAGGFPLNVDREVGLALKAAGKFIMEGRDAEGRQQMFRPAVTFYLNSVQFLREGASLGGTTGVKAFEDAPASASDDADLFR